MLAMVRKQIILFYLRYGKLFRISISICLFGVMNCPTMKPAAMVESKIRKIRRSSTTSASASTRLFKALICLLEVGDSGFQDRESVFNIFIGVGV